ncbi:hypothetical protein TNCV_2053961 [Trichonephila clavipes]|nr:hypothetical protein TNCV_2053961 [Trichonephila clavipes]
MFVAGRGIDSKKREMLRASTGPSLAAPLRNINQWLVPPRPTARLRRRDESAASCRTVALGGRMKGVQPKRYVIGFMRGLSRRARPTGLRSVNPATVRPEEDGLLNIEIGSNMIGAKCCLQTGPDSVQSVTPGVLLCGGTGALGNNPAFVRERTQYRRAGWMDDNARPHRARLVENMLEAKTIQRMEWPACSH